MNPTTDLSELHAQENRCLRHSLFTSYLCQLAFVFATYTYQENDTGHMYVCMLVYMYICIYTHIQCMDGWMAGWVAGWLAGLLAGWLHGWMDGWMDGRMDGRTDGRMGGWVDGWMGGRKGWMDVKHSQACTCAHCTCMSTQTSKRLNMQQRTSASLHVQTYLLTCRSITSMYASVSIHTVDGINPALP